MKNKTTNKKKLKELAAAERWYNITKNLSCALCGWFCNNMHHHNNWYEVEPNKTDSMTKEQLFAKYKIDESHSKWNDLVDNWLSVEIYRIMNYDELPSAADRSSKHLLAFLDKINSDELFVKSLQERKPNDFDRLRLTAKRSIYLCSELILKELNN